MQPGPNWAVVGVTLVAMATLTIAAILTPSDVVKSDLVDVKASVLDDTKRDADGKETFQIDMIVDMKRVIKQFRKLGHSSEVRLYKMDEYGRIQLQTASGEEAEWTTYGSEEGSILVKNDSQHGYRLEGSLHIHEEVYFIQPDENSKRHVIHTVKQPDHVPSNRDSPKRMKRRVKRDGVKYEVEYFMVVDQWLYKIMKSTKSKTETADDFMKAYYGLMINEINHRYEYFRTKWHLDIEIVMAGVMTCMPRKCPKMPYRGEVLNGLGDWLKKNTNIQKMDIVHLHTTRKLKDGVKGRAWHNAACTVKNYGIIHNDMDFIAIHTATHELGHNLGMFHDKNAHNHGHSHDSKGCDGNYIMHDTYNYPLKAATPENMWKFSECSYEDLKTFIGWLDKSPKAVLDYPFKRTDGGKNCLKTRTSAWPDTPLDGHNLLGANLTLDQQCNRMKKGSKFCQNEQLKYDQGICLSIFCTTPRQPSKCWGTFSYPGTPCGDLKICKYGKCENDPTHGKAQTECPYGEATEIEIDGKKMTCAEVIKQNPGHCYKYERQCCLTCKTIRKTATGNCRYGDHPISITLFDKPYYTCQSTFHVSNIVCYEKLAKCCESCPKLLNSSNVNCTYGDKLRTTPLLINKREYKNCAKAIERARGICYTKVAIADCCRSCPSIKDKNPKCPYGNRIGNVIYDYDGRLNTCSNVIEESTANKCYAEYDSCCESCEKLRNRDNPNCPYGDNGSGLPSGRCKTEYCTDQRFATYKRFCCKTCRL